MPTLDLTDDEAAALVRCLHHGSTTTRSRWHRGSIPLKAILAKLDPPALRPESSPPLRAGVRPRVERTGDPTKIRVQLDWTCVVLVERD
jgi:hypothetical protein